MEQGQKFMAVSRYNGECAKKFSYRLRGYYTFLSQGNGYILTQQRTNRGMPVMIFNKVFKVVCYK